MLKQKQNTYTPMGANALTGDARIPDKRRSETCRRKMSVQEVIMSSAKLSNCDEESNNNVGGLIRAGSGPCCLGSVSVSL